MPHLLLLGGCTFVGKHVTDAALKRGLEVTAFNRGSKAPLAGVRSLIGDRNEDVSALASDTTFYDVVIDTSAQTSLMVESVATALKGRVGQYVLVSTISVYSDPIDVSKAEDADLVEPHYDEGPAEFSGEIYGNRKVACEEVVKKHFPTNHTLARATLIVGPDDPTNRMTYWVRRLGGTRKGEVLAPQSDQPVQWIDVKDLSDWMLHAGLSHLIGPYNLTGPSTPFAEMLREMPGYNECKVSHTTEGFLLSQSVTPWVGLPLFLPSPKTPMMRVNADRAVKFGLVTRPMSETARDILEWCRETMDENTLDMCVLQRPTGLVGITTEREAEILNVWHSRN
eukprot:comp98107_c0_seq1/m.48691 comp98107_c0_seq1/g.48691  ORF comp98107_c0_seq1/g.48691 comp98107_c0_seq1/m.48691 type:complete len:339 (-) comp98107_c0_seq1:182-1198(-)